MDKICLDRFGRLHIAKTWVNEDPEDKDNRFLSFSYCGFDFNTNIIIEVENIDFDKAGICEDCEHIFKFYEAQDRESEKRLNEEICNTFGLNHYINTLEDLENSIKVIYKNYTEVNFRFCGISMFATIFRESEEPYIFSLIMTDIEEDKKDISCMVRSWFTQVFVKKRIIKKLNF